MTHAVAKARVIVALAITAVALVAVPRVASAHTASLACADATHITITNDINLPVTFTFLRADGTQVTTAEVGPIIGTLSRTIPTPAGATSWFAAWPDGFRQPAAGSTPMPPACMVAGVTPPTTTTTAAPATTTTTAAAPAPTTTTTTEPGAVSPASDGTTTTTTLASSGAVSSNSTTASTTKVGVLGQSANRALPSTGASNVLPLVLVGSATLLLGGVLLVASRRRDPFTGKLR